MKSIKRPSKPINPTTKSNNLGPKPELVAYRPAEQHPVTLQLDPDPSDERQPPDVQQAMPLGTFSTNAEKPLSLEKGKAHMRDRQRLSDKASKKSDDARQSKQDHFERSDELELPPERCQHIQFLDCNSSVGRVIFECWHCQQGIISEYTGEPVMGEFKGRPSLIQLKIQCPNCEQTAIKLTTGEVLSTTAIPSPWQQ